ncbi:hypothetical protein Srubr_81600 [Streptomyces rubradiris]|uniref:Uncharacterized protein n=1 Tax=Streptomyces rubradiris TaxID=285531 RepID=A0ABQ3RR42_STRRR|nr:hypothetical protein Srubr_81600 [Streptomyces rubradiris]
MELALWAADEADAPVVEELTIDPAVGCPATAGRDIRIVVGRPDAFSPAADHGLLGAARSGRDSGMDTPRHRTA